MSTARITTRGRVTIPKAVRSRLGVETGDRLHFVVAPDGTCTVFPITRDVRALKGIIARPTKPVSLRAMKRAAWLRSGRRTA